MAAIAAGCAKEPANPETEKVNDSEDAQVPQTELVSYSFSATLEAPVGDDPVEGKASISDAGVFSWSAGDEIAVWNAAESAFVTFTCNAGDGVFTASATPGAEFTKAYYPASVAVAGNPDQVNLASSYSLAESTSGKFFPMVATVSGSNLAFTHLGSLLKFTINDVPADATSLTLTSATAVLSGNFAVQSGQINAGSGAGSVSVSISHSVKENLAFYFPVPVGNYSYTITLGDGTTTMLTKATTSAKTLARASLHGLKALTVDNGWSTNYKLIGYFNYGGTDAGWSSSTLIPFEKTDYYGWLKASDMVTINHHVDFKLYDSGTYVGVVLDGDHRQITGLINDVASAGEGNNITVYSGANSMDVYYNPLTSKLFVLESGADFYVPTATLGTIDGYVFTGSYDGGDWNDATARYLETVPGQDDWRVIKSVTTNASNYVSFKFKVYGTWDGAYGAGIQAYKAAGKLIQMGSLFTYTNDCVIDNGAGTYDIYVNKAGTVAFALTSGSSFSIPGTHDHSQHFGIIGKFNINNTDYNWESDVLAFVPVPDNPEWLYIPNASIHSSESFYMGFKIRFDSSWTYQVGFSSPDPWKNLGNFEDTVTSPNTPENCNFYVPDGNTYTVDIYLKADLSKIGIFTHGSTPVFP